MHPRRPLLALIGCSILLTACTPPEPTPTPTPTPEPTYQCTPIFGGDPTTCTQQDYDDLQAKLAQYAEAEQIYRDSLFNLEEAAAAREPISEELTETATGAYLESATESLIEAQNPDLVFSGHQEVIWVKPADLSDQGSDLALEVCVSPGTYRLVVAGEATDPTWYIHRVFYTSDPRLQLSSMKWEAVDEC